MAKDLVSHGGLPWGVGGDSWRCKVQPAIILLCVLMQGAELPAEAVSGLPGGAGGPAGVGEWGAAAADNQPGSQLLLRPVSLRFDTRSHPLYGDTVLLLIFSSFGSFRRIFNEVH